MNGVFIYDNALDDAEVLSIFGPSAEFRHEGALLDGCPYNQWGPLWHSTNANYVVLDLGSEQTIAAAGLVNHNFYSARVDTVWMGGNNDGGDAFAFAYGFSHLDDYDHDPCTAGLFTTPTAYRYWQIILWSSAGQSLVGGFSLAREVYELDEAPDEPFREGQQSQLVSAETEGGSERRQLRGEPYYDRTLRWKSVPAAMALEFQKMWVRQHGRSRPFLYVAHDKDQPTAQGYYKPEIVRFGGLTIRELEPGGDYSVTMTLVGLLRIGY